MAISTKHRRSSALNFGTVRMLPPPASGVDVLDRAHLAGMYSGFSYTVLSPFTLAACQAWYAGAYAVDSYAANPAESQAFTAGSVAAQESPS